LNIAIIGAGATGLTAGYELSKKGHHVTVYEAEDDVGGLASTFTAGTQLLEKLYHHIFTNDTYVTDLLQELGLISKLQWVSPKSGLYINQKLYDFSTPKDLLMFKEIPFFERIALGMLVLKSRFIKDWKSLEKITAKDWLIKNAGPNAYEKFWGPLMNSKFDLDAEQIPAVWLWNKFKLRGSTRGSNTGKEMFGYLEGSFGELYKALKTEIEKRNGKVLLSSPVERITLNKDKTIQITAPNGSASFQKVLFTLATGLLKQIMPELPASYIEKINKIKYKANICMVMGIQSSLSPYYWITIAEKESPFVLMIEHTNLMPAEPYKSGIIYLSMYLDADSSLYQYPDSKIENLFLDYLEKMFPSFNRTDILWTKIFRSDFAQPVVCPDYSNVIPEHETPVPNLYIANMSQIYPEDRGQNYSIALGRKIAELLNE